MDVKIIPKSETSEAEVLITVPAPEFKPYLERAARTLSQEHPLKGFRPGKAPLSAALESFGRERVLQEGLSKAMPHFFVQAVLEHNIDAIGRPTVAINTLNLEEGLAFTATVAVLPEVTLGDVTAISVSKRAVSVTEEDVAKELAYLAKLRSTPLEVARPATTGDTVTLDFKVSMNGTVLEGGESKNHPVHLGEGHFVPDFEKKLEGIQAGDTREFTIHFPSDYAKQDLRDKEAQVWVHAHAVQKRIIPELNDEFAKKLGKFESLAQVKEELKKNMLHEKEHKEQDRLQGELAEALAAQARFGHIADILIEKEIDRRLEEFSQMLGYQQKTIEDYMAAQNKSIQDIRNDMRDSAIKAVKIGLALRAFAEQEEITVEEAAVEEKMNEYLQRYASTKDAEKDIDKEELKDSIMSTLRNQKVLKELETRVKVKQENATAEKTK